jgi:hypothetical protein
VQFTSAARDPEGRQLLIVWAFGDGGRAGGPSISHTYRTPGTYSATVTVTDPEGATATASTQIRVSGPTARATPPPRDESEGDVAGDSAEHRASLRAPKSQRIARSLRLRVACPDDCVVRAVARHAGKRIGASRKLRIRDGRRHTLTVRLSGQARRELRRAGVRSVRVTVVLRVRTADGESAVRRVVRLHR